MMVNGMSRAYEMYWSDCFDEHKHRSTTTWSKIRIWNRCNDSEFANGFGAIGLFFAIVKWIAMDRVCAHEQRERYEEIVRHKQLSKFVGLINVALVYKHIIKRCTMTSLYSRSRLHSASFSFHKCNQLM